MIKVGTIINTHALKGECKLYLVTDDPEHRFSKGRVLYFQDGKSITVKKYREQKGFGYCYFEGVDSIEQAELLKGKDLFIKKEDLPELDDDSFYYHELMGCTVFNENEEELGVVTDILETGANIVLRVSKDEKSFLLPFVDAFVNDVDVEKKIMRITEMEGLR